VGRFRREWRSAICAEQQLKPPGRELLVAALLLAAFAQRGFRAELLRAARLLRATKLLRAAELLRAADLFVAESQLSVFAPVVLAA